MDFGQGVRENFVKTQVMPLPVFPNTKKWKSCNNMESPIEVAPDLGELEEEGGVEIRVPETAKTPATKTGTNQRVVVTKATKKTEDKTVKQQPTTKRVKSAPMPIRQTLKSNSRASGILRSQSRHFSYHQMACTTSAASINNGSGGIKSSIYNQTEGMVIAKKIRQKDKNP